MRNALTAIANTLPHFKRKEVPLIRPRKVEHFINRKNELTQLLNDLKSGRIVTLCGPGGVGKSALASKVLWILAPGDKAPKNFPDGIIWHDFYTEPRSSIFFEKIAKIFNEESLPTPIEAAQKILANKKMLLLLDGAEDADDLRMILDITDSCCVLVTSRQKKDAVAVRQDIESLSHDQAVNLLQSWAGKQNIKVMEKICKLVGCLPLAVRLIGKYLYETGEDAIEYLEWIEDTPLDALNQGNRKIESVPILLHKSFSQISINSVEILSITGLLAFDSFSSDLIVSVLPEIKNIKRSLNELVNFGILNRSKDRFQISHALIHTYVRHNNKLTKEMIKKVSEYFNSFTRKHSKNGTRGYTKIDQELVHIMKILTECKKMMIWESAIKLVWSVNMYLNMKGLFTELNISLRIGIEAAQKLNNRRDEAALIGNIGCNFYSYGLIDKAIEHYVQALSINKEIGNKHGETIWLSNIGLAYLKLGKIDKSIEFYEKSLSISKKISDIQGEGETLGSIGLAYHLLGYEEDAIQYYEQALTISRETLNKRNESNWLGNLGNAYRDIGQLYKAINYHKMALSKRS